MTRNREIGEFFWPQRVYYQHTDAGGVVYHGNYLDFMECARTELLQSLGLDLGHLARREHLVFMVHSAQIAYHKPARLNDLVSVTARVARIGRARLVFEQSVRRGEETLATAELTLACVDARTQKPIGVPDTIRIKLEQLA